MHDLDLSKFNLETFSRKEVVEKYGGANYWRADEEVLTDKYFTKKNGRLLILGCGGGRSVVRLAKEGFEIAALDMSSNMIEIAKRNMEAQGIRANLLVRDAVDLSCFRSESFDYVFFPFHGIDYIYPKDRRIRCFKEVFRVLKRGGVFIYNSHNRFFYKTFIKFLIRGIKDGNWGNYFLDKSGIERELWTYLVNPFEEIKILKSIFSKIERFGRNIFHRKLFTDYGFLSVLAKRFFSNLIVRWLYSFLDDSIYFVSVK